VGEVDPGPIVVAVRNPGESSAATEFALREAQRRGCGVRLVHVVHGHPSTAEELAVGGHFKGPAQEMLIVMAAELEKRTEGRVPVSTLVDSGPVVTKLLRGARDASLLVLGERDRVSRRWAGTVRLGVSSGSDVPVVCVPSTWQPRRHDVVAVGVNDPSTVGPALPAALEVARRRGSPLRVVHAVWFAEPLDDAGLAPARVEELVQLAESELRHTLERLEPEVSAVPVQVHVVHGHPVDVLVRASETAGVLVVGRHDPPHHLGRRLNHVVRSVLQNSWCPVMVAGDHASRLQSLGPA
jgi:nucleotide-binding universal stress UspA family protein